MRLNQYIALATGISRRAADRVIDEQKVSVNGQPAELGQKVESNDQVRIDGELIILPSQTTTIMLNKPVGYVCSRDGQGSKTIYDLLPNEHHNLKPVGRLDKDSSGLLLLTNDGELAHKLTHPSFIKEKVYEVELDKPLEPNHKTQIEQGIMLADGPSQLNLAGNNDIWTVTMHEGRNRQIRRTFIALGYKVKRLHRKQFGTYRLNGLAVGKYRLV